MPYFLFKGIKCRSRKILNKEEPFYFLNLKKDFTFNCY